MQMLGGGAANPFFASQLSGGPHLQQLERQQETEMQQLLATMNQEATLLAAAQLGAAGLDAASMFSAAAQTQAGLITITSPSSLTTLGMPAQAPAVVYQKGDGVFSSANHILGEIVGNIGNSVEIIHDPDWQQFPEVGRAIKQVFGQEDCFAIATCESRARWAVGIGGSWKNRENAAKVALALALTGQPLAFYQAGHQFPVDSSSNGYTEPSKKKKARTSWESKDQTPTKAIVPLRWVTIGEGAPLGQLGYGFTRDAPAVTYSTDVPALECADAILTNLVGSVATAVQLIHGMDGFPQVTAAAKGHAGMSTAGICLAVCKAANSWAVGLDHREECAEQAAKLALSVALAPLTDHLPLVVSAFPDFATCLQEALEPGSTSLGKPRQEATKWPQNSGSSWSQNSSGASTSAESKPQWFYNSEGGMASRPLQRDTPLRISFATGGPLPQALKRVLPEGVAVASDGKKRPKLYGQIDSVLAALLVNPDQELEYHDDSRWTEFAVLGDALRTITDEKVGMNVAVCPAYGAWGIGLGANYWNRNAGAKVALACVLYLKACEVGPPPDFSELSPSFENFVYELMPAAAPT